MKGMRLTRDRLQEGMEWGNSLSPRPTFLPPSRQDSHSLKSEGESRLASPLRSGDEITVASGMKKVKRGVVSWQNVIAACLPRMLRGFFVFLFGWYCLDWT